jgi:RNA polymerase sigma-70 factor (ECF subfamily)
MHGSIAAACMTSRGTPDPLPRDSHAAAAEPVLPISKELVAALPRLTRYARFLSRNRADADDLLQDAVVRILGAATSYRPGTNFGAWACTVMRNRFLSVHVRGHRRTVSIDDVILDVPHHHPSQLDGLEHQDLVDQFMRLPEENRCMLTLADGTAYEDIALASGCAVGTVKSRVHRARSALRSMLREAYEPRSPEASQSAETVLRNRPRGPRPPADWP